MKDRAQSSKDDARHQRQQLRASVAIAASPAAGASLAILDSVEAGPQLAAGAVLIAHDKINGTGEVSIPSRSKYPEFPMSEQVLDVAVSASKVGAEETAFRKNHSGPEEAFHGMPKQVLSASKHLWLERT